VGRILAIPLILPLFLFFLPFLTNASDVGLEESIQHYLKKTNEQIAEYSWGIHYSAVNRPYAKLKEQVSVDRRLSALVDEVDSYFETWHHSCLFVPSM
jgi:hypothetical protein